MNHKIKHDLTMFFKYLATYLIIVVVFVVLLIPVYKSMYSVTQKNTLDNFMKEVNDSTEIINSKIEKMITISKLVRRDASFSRIAKIIGEPSANEYFYINKAKENLNELSRQYDFSINAYALFNNNKIFISNVMASEDYHNIFNNHLIYKDILGSEILKLAMDSKKSMRFLPIQDVWYLDGIKYRALTCIIKMSDDGYNNYDSSMFFTMDINELFKATGIKEGDKNEFIQILDNEGNILVNYNYDGEAIHFDPKIDSNIITKYKLGEDYYSLIHSRTEYGNLNIVRGTKEIVFKEKIDSVLNTMYWYIIVGILFAIIFSLLMTYFRYLSIQQILSIVRPKSNIPANKSEYKYISSAFLQISHKNEQYEEEISDMQKSIKNSVIEKLLFNGIYTEAEKKEISDYVGTIDCFCVLSIIIPKASIEVNSNSNSNTNSNTITITNIGRYSEIAHYIVNDLEKKYNNIQCINRGTEEIACLILLNPEDDSNTKEIAIYMNLLYQRIKNIFEQNIIIGISNIGNDAENVHTCYLHAKHAIRQMDDEIEIFVTAYIQQDESSNSLEEFNLEKQLLELILAGDKNAINTMFERVNKYTKKSIFSSEDDIMQLFYAIRNPIVNAHKALNNKSEGIEIPKYNDRYTINQLLDLLENKSLELCECSLKKKRSNSNNLKELILKYIDEEYSNANLCAALVAEKFDISEKYVFNFIKEHTFKPFGKFVESIRLENAKELLTNTEFSATEISEKVGFSSVNTFYKSFNRVYGITPINWRNNSREKLI